MNESNFDQDVVIAMQELKKIKNKNKGSRPRIADPKSPFMGMTQVLEIVPVSKSTLYLMMQQGRFPKNKSLGGRVAVWSKKEIEEWLTSVIN